MRPCIKPLGVLSRHPCRNPKPLPHGEGLCMLSWLCICAIVVVCCRCVLHRLCSTTCMRPCIKPLGVLSRHPCRNPKPLPHGEGLCMLSWLCICAIVVVCCRCVLHRLCSTTCMRPCIEHLGIHARRPCRAECGAAALTKQGRLQSVAHSRCTMQ